VSEFSVGEETIPECSGRDGRVGQTITVDRSVATAPAPTAQFFEHDAFNVVGDARLVQAGKNAGDLWHD
jgi:hypothetical protein